MSYYDWDDDDYEEEDPILRALEEYGREYAEERLRKRVNKLNAQFMPKWKAFLTTHEKIAVWSNDQPQDFCLVCGTYEECLAALKGTAHEHA